MLRLLSFFICCFLFISCEFNSQDKRNLQLSDQFKNYWYSGKAEITSYDLNQARYGEMRKGEAVLIYVTEDFLPDEQVKANQQKSNNISVLKLNSTKKFITGIYPYSIMQSSFYPLNGERHALKLAASIQEWCGQVYLQLNKNKNFQITSHSYFQGEADKDFSVKKTNLENEIWNKLRVEPNSLPIGDFEMIPSLEYLRLSHKPLKTYISHGEYFTEEDFNVYMLQYPELQRKLKIYYRKNFPYTIEKWEESYPSGFGENSKILTTTAKKKRRIRTDYWNKNSNKNISLRDSLDLN